MRLVPRGKATLLFSSPGFFFFVMVTPFSLHAPQGFFCLTMGLVAPTSSCAAGKYSNIGASECTDCAAGKFQNATGSTFCL